MRNLFVQSGSSGRSACAFGEGFLFFQEQENGAGNFFFVDGDDLVDQLPGMLIGQFGNAANGANVMREL